MTGKEEEVIKKQKENTIQEKNTKQITVRVSKDNLKTLKVLSTIKDMTSEKMATSIIDDEIIDLDIVKFVEDSYSPMDIFEKGYGTWLNSNELSDEEIPKKRINVKVDAETHKKLKIISAIEDRSLDDIVSSIIEHAVEEDNLKDTSKLIDDTIQ